ncbi:MAG: hypothetical protein K2M80_00570 [Muribaculaceae bacterium]|nr:hypothetical protein [Muribaculaceae bacterium]
MTTSSTTTSSTSLAAANLSEAANTAASTRSDLAAARSNHLSPEIKAMLEENARREKAFLLRNDYDPATGRGCTGPRREVNRCRYANYSTLWLPESMLADPEYTRVKSAADFRYLRCAHDFEYWAITCAKIKEKDSARIVPFRLNHAQRRVLAQLEEDRLADRPLRFILLKARQWGASTFIQTYMAWIQCCLRRNWNSLISAQIKDSAANIRGMYSRILENYPAEYWREDEKPAFKAFQGSQNTRLIAGRECCVTLSTSENQDAMRGFDIAMAHLTEVAYWRDTPSQRPEDFIAAICGSINYKPMTLIVIESTANGVGNYFHNEWLRAVAGESDKRPIFVPWYEIEIYRTTPDDPATLAQSLTDEERRLWDRGLSLSQINWYRHRRREQQSVYRMMAEFPSTPDEAFMATDLCVFDRENLQKLEQYVEAPSFKGDIVAKGGNITGNASLKQLQLQPAANGNLEVWERPKPDQRYVVAVDIGGRSAKADWSVIVVVSIGPPGHSCSLPAIVAQWRGHIDHDLLAWKATQLATYYNRGLLVFESNTLEHEAIEGEPADYILAQIADSYSNLYTRQGGSYGFHVNRSTKTFIIARLIAMVRDSGWIERSREAFNELTTYEAVPGTRAFGASQGHHDDLVMARAIAFEVAATADFLNVSDASDTDMASYLYQFRW